MWLILVGNQVFLISIFWWLSLSLLFPTIKDQQLKAVWEIFDFVWGNPSSESNAGALSALNSDISTTTQLSIEDGVVEPAAEHDDGSVTTTEPEQTPENTNGDDPIEPIELEHGHGMTDEEWKNFSQKYPTLAVMGNCDGTQPETLSPPAPSPSPPAASASVCMGPPAPLSPATLERKRKVQERLVELRWGTVWVHCLKTNASPFFFKRCSPTVCKTSVVKWLPGATFTGVFFQPFLGPNRLKKTPAKGEDFNPTL